MPPKAEPQRHGDERRYQVVYKRVAFRCQPSTKAGIVHVAQRGSTVYGTVREIGGEQWLRLSASTCSDCVITSDEAWVLVHGASIGLGDLLRPAHEEVECLEELLWRLGGENGDRVRPVVDALHRAGLRTGSQLLAATETRAARGELQLRIKLDAEERGCDVHGALVRCLCIAVEDSRLAFSGFPNPPPWTKVRILFTAPHSLALCREGHKFHLPEGFTSFLARDFAQIVGGAFLTWAQKEEGRAKEHYKFTGSPDPTNKDPNFTRQEVLCDSPWARNLQEVRHLFGPGRPCLHMDLHGCKDPTAAGGSHLVVGLRAMEFAGAPDVEELRSSLFMVFSAVLRGVSVNVRPLRQLTGALEDDRRTLTQQSLCQEGGGWTYAVQLEMSKSLRKLLAGDREVRTLVAQAIMFAWTLTCKDSPDAVAVIHALQYWVARCKSYYLRRNITTLLPPEGAEASKANLAASPAKPEAGDAKAEAKPEAGDVKAEPGEAKAEPGYIDEEDERDERLRQEGVGEDTANTEAPTPPYEGSVTALEADLVRKARALEGYDHPDCVPPPPPPTPVAMLRDWLRCSTVDETLSPKPENEYFIVGSWNDFVPTLMHWDGSRFVHSLKIGPNGWEGFQILLGGSWERTLYPSEINASLATRHSVVGPDGKGHGKNWMIGHNGMHSSKAAPAKHGEYYKVILVLSCDAMVTKVLWERLGEDEADVLRAAEGVEERRRKAAEETEARLRAEKEAELKRKADAEHALEMRRKAREEEARQRAEAEAAEAERQRAERDAERKRERKRQAEERISEMWALTPDDLDVVVNIERSLGLNCTLTVQKGETIMALKERIARMDPTGMTRAEDFGLTETGNDDLVLEGSWLVTLAMTEFDIFHCGS